MSVFFRIQSPVLKQALWAIFLLAVLVEPFSHPSLKILIKNADLSGNSQLLRFYSKIRIPTSSRSMALMAISSSRPNNQSPKSRSSSKSQLSKRGADTEKNKERNVSTKNKKTAASVQFNKYLQKLIKSNVQVAEETLWQRIESGCPDYDTVSFNIVLNGWAKQRSMFAAQRADELLSQLQELQQSHCRLKADTYSYASVLNAYAKSGGGKAAAVRAEELLEELQLTYKTLDTDVCHNAVMDGWSVSGDPRAGERAEKLLRKLDKPTRISYNSCIKAFARSQAPHEAQRLLEEMKTLAETTHPHLEPDKISISSCIDAWSKWTGNLTEAAFQAENLLQEMERDFEIWNETSSGATRDLENTSFSKRNFPTLSRKQPDVVTYTAVLTAFARSGLPEAPEKALELIRRMDLYSDEKPNAPFFNAFIHLLAKTRSPPKWRGANQSSQEDIAEAILREMKTQYQETSDEDILPCKITYTAVIAVYASHSRTVAAAERVDELLNELEELYDQTHLDSYLPNTKTYGAVMSVWAVTASLANSQGYNYAFAPDALWQKAESLLARMEELYQKTKNVELKPTSILYSQVFRILANGRDPRAAERGLQLLKKMKELSRDPDYGEYISVDSTIYAYLVVTFTKAGLGNLAEAATTVLRDVEESYKLGNGDLKPTSLLYSAVLQAYAKSGSAKLAIELLERTKEMYRAGKLYAKPTTLFYNACIDACARSKGGRDAAERAEALLEEMELRGRAGDPELQLSARSFNAAILAWKNSNAQDAPEKAEALLKRMNEVHKEGNKLCRPDRVTINSIIGVWAKKSPEEGAAACAKKFLDFLERLYDSSGDLSIKPDRYSYNSVIDAYSRCSTRDAADQAQALYDRMKALADAGDEDLRPDVITLTSLRKAWMTQDADDRETHLQQIGDLILNHICQADAAKQSNFSEDSSAVADSALSLF